MQHSMISMALAAVSLRDLALVQAVYRHGSFNSAARAMHISPSGLSHQVQKVEQALGAPLFERGGRRIVPTAGGQRLLQQIDAVLAAGEHLQQVARAGAVAFGGELRLGVPASLGPYLLPHLIAPFPQHFPGARLSLSEGKPRGLLRRLHEGELDAVLAPPTPAVSGIAMRPLFAEPWELMLRADHPLAGQNHIALDQLDPAEATLMAESHADGLDGDGSEHGHVQDVSLESLAALVSLRGGYALVPALAHERLASMPNIVLATLKGQAPGREIALYWRDASPWRDDLQAFAELLRKLARQRPGLRVMGVKTKAAMP
ncbi:LysR family transcriptional regulator [Rhodanobacter sp. C01]|uniref:LysR family transcriptional regulator n=1 Tax=Rhodanobacter sp. C01 TaxID=1945856 RepID=UPI000985D6A7|nr:LysR family transcriptional regulator [Rhodanobacter sp. C01]OOG46930.1 LysR family transcriptional regulator [Rhodanobacter sp. C01]